MSPDSLDSMFTQSDEFVYAFITNEQTFTNWSAHQISIWGEHFQSVEHAYQFRKYTDEDVTWARKIKDSKSPFEAKKIAWMRAINAAAWDTKRERLMYELILAKVTQHEDVRKALESTGSRAIIEKGNSTDSFWGIGADKKGKNTLGVIWMLIRQQLAYN